jgi:hypothetical protein
MVGAGFILAGVLLVMWHKPQLQSPAAVHSKIES